MVPPPTPLAAEDPSMAWVSERKPDDADKDGPEDDPFLSLWNLLALETILVSKKNSAPTKITEVKWNLVISVFLSLKDTKNSLEFN